MKRRSPARNDPRNDPTTNYVQSMRAAARHGFTSVKWATHLVRDARAMRVAFNAEYRALEQEV